MFELPQIRRKNNIAYGSATHFIALCAHMSEYVALALILILSKSWREFVIDLSKSTAIWLTRAMKDDPVLELEKSKISQKIDDIDLQIIELLKATPRATNKSLAESINVAESTIAQRIRSLSQNGVVRVVAQREIFSDGYDLMSFAEIEVHGDVDEVAAQLSAHPAAISVSRCLGTPQLLATLRGRGRQDLDKVLNHDISGIDGVTHIGSHICLKIQKLESGFGDLTSRLPCAAFDLGDGRDAEIMRLLLEDGRTSNREIARRLDVSEGSIRQRLKRLYESSQLRLGVVVDPFTAGGAATAIFKIKTRSDEIDKAMTYLVSQSFLSFVASTTGDLGIWCLAQAPDFPAISKLVEQLNRNVPGYSDLFVMPLAHNYLHRYDLVRIR